MKKRRLSTRLKLFIAFAAISLLTAGLSSVQSFLSAQRIIYDTQEHSLVTIRNVKTEQIESEINTMLYQFLYFSMTDEVMRGVRGFSRAYNNSVIPTAEQLGDCDRYLNGYYREALLSNLSSDLYTYKETGNYLPRTISGRLFQCRYLKDNIQLDKPEFAQDINPVYEDFYKSNHGFF